MSTDKVYVAYYWYDGGRKGGSYIKMYGVFRSKESAIEQIKASVEKNEEGEHYRIVDDPEEYAIVFDDGKDNYCVKTTFIEREEI